MEPAHEIPSLELLLAQEGWVRALARKLVSRESEAEDVAQSALAVALEHPPRSGESVPVLRAWLGQVARRLVIGGHRTESRRLERERRVARAEALPSASEIHAQEEERRIVVEALLALGEPFRTTLLLRYYRGLEPIEIARAMDVPDSTVRNRLARGLAQLKQKLEARQGSDWRTSCALLAGPLVPASKGVLIGKGVVMGVNLKVAISCSVVALAGLAWWGLRGNGTEAPKPAQLELASVQKLSSETDKPAEDASNSPAMRAKVESDPSAAGATALVANDPVGILVYGAVRQKDGGPTRGQAWMRLLSSAGVEFNQTADANGAFAFTSVTAGEWRLEARLSGYRECQRTLQLDPSQPVCRADLVLEQRICIPVRFLAPDGLRLSEALGPMRGGPELYLGLRLSAIATEQAVQSTTPVRTLGSLERYGLGEYHPGGTGYTGKPPEAGPNGDGLLVVEDRFPMYISATWRGIVLESQRHEVAPKEVVFKLQPERVLGLIGGFKVRLVDAEDKKPVRSYMVNLHHHGQDLSMGIGEDGILDLPRLPPGLVELAVEPGGYEPLYELIDVQPGSVTDLGTRELARATNSEIKVADEGGAALADVTFSYADGYSDPQQPPRTARTMFASNSQGVLHCQRGPGTRWLVANDPRWAAAPLLLGSGSQRIVMKPGAELVVSFGTSVLADTVLVVRDSSGACAMTEDAQGGELVRRRLLPGRYELELVSFHGTLLKKSIELGEKPLVIDLAP